MAYENYSKFALSILVQQKKLLPLCVLTI